tara:strand:- start:206 stop:436 length:231 start_codon:yes stop_codon:yes gene_type:complete
MFKSYVLSILPPSSTSYTGGGGDKGGDGGKRGGGEGDGIFGGREGAASTVILTSGYACNSCVVEFSTHNINSPLSN